MERNLTFAIKIIETKNGHCRNINFFFLWRLFTHKIANQRTHCALCLSLEGGPFTFSGGRGWVDLVIHLASLSLKCFPKAVSGVFNAPPFWSEYETIDSMQWIPSWSKFLRYIKVYVSIFRKECKASVKNIFLFRNHSSLQNLLS